MHSQKLLCARGDFRFHAIIFIMKRWKDLKPITRYLILLAITLGLLINFGSVCAHYVREWIKAAQAPVTETAAPAQPSAAPTSSSVPEATEDTAGSYTVEEHPITLENKYIFGKTYLPDDGKDTHPLVILCHGIGTNHFHAEPFAKRFAEHGIAAYAFDFCGGGDPIQSSGTLYDMSVHTEEEDLKDVLRHLQETGIAKDQPIILLGISQGGYVVTETAADLPDEIAGLILLFPAFNINDLINAEFSSPEDVPESVTIFDQTVSRRYFVDAMNEPIREDMKQYAGPVLLLHGSGDPIVPAQYSLDAAEQFPNAEVHLIDGAEHGFFGPHEDEAFAYCMEFLRSSGIIDN